jgi:radical SAM protein with 4Fe4S-binding SPASM domain
VKFHRAYIEITNVCGLACSFCPPKDQPTQTMTLPFFESILLQLQEHTRDIALHVMGDPMVLSNLDDYLEIAHRLGFSVMITTSGFYLDESRRAMLFHPCIKQVNVSLNSFNKNSVSRSFAAYMENILAFCDEKLNQPCEFFINLRLWNLDEACSEDAFNEQLFSILEQHFKLENKFIRSSISGERQSLRVASKILLHFDRYFQWPSLNNEVSGDGYCHGISKQIAILADGRVVPCCLDGEGAIELGNLHVTNLGKILTSERVSTMINGFKEGKAVEELCQKCSYKKRFEKGVL